MTTYTTSALYLDGTYAGDVEANVESFINFDGNKPTAFRGFLRISLIDHTIHESQGEIALNDTVILDDGTTVKYKLDIKFDRTRSTLAACIHDNQSYLVENLRGLQLESMEQVADLLAETEIASYDTDEDELTENDKEAIKAMMRTAVHYGDVFHEFGRYSFRYQFQTVEDVQEWAEGFDGTYPRNGQEGYFDTPIRGEFTVAGITYYIVKQ